MPREKTQFNGGYPEANCIRPGQRNNQARRGRDRKSRPDGSRTDAGFRRPEELAGEAFAFELQENRQ